MRNLIIFLLGVFLLGNNTPRENIVKNAVSSSITKDGFAEISAYAKNNLLQDIPWSKFPDQDIFVDGFFVSLHGIYLKAAFGDLYLSPQDSRLDIQVGLHDIDFYIKEFTIKSLVPITCYETKVFIGHASAQPLNIPVRPTLRQGRISMIPLGSDLQIDADNYNVDGPKECQGLSFSLPLVQMIVESAFENARSQVQDLIAAKVNEMVPEMERLVNQMIKNPPPLQIKNFPLVKDINLGFDIYPTDLKINKGGLTFSASLAIKEVTREETRQDLGRADAPQIPFVLGQGNIKAELANELLTVLFKNGSKRLEVNDQVFPGLGGGISKDMLAPYLPDLTESVFTSEDLKLFIQVNSAPQVSFDKEQEGLRVVINNLDYIYQAQINGEWQDYFQVSMNISLGVVPKIKDREFILSALANNSLTVISGNWAPGYTPKNPSFDKARMEKDFNDFVNFLPTANYIYKAELPTFPLQGEHLTIGELTMADPYVFMKLVGYQN